MALPSDITRDYSGGVVEGVQITAEMGSSDQSFTIANTTGWTNAAGNALGTAGPFTVVIDLNTASVEKILCSSVNLLSGLVTVYNVGGNSGRGYDQTTAQAHVPGTSTVGVVPCWSAVEAAEANAAVVVAVGAPSTAQTLAAGTTITPNARTIQVIQSSGSNITLTAAPTITAGTSGQRLTIVNVGTVSGSGFIFQSKSSLAGSTLSLGATTRTVGIGGSLSLVYNTALTRWVETGFNGGTFG
jgi:hypothetical protein